MTAYFIGLMSGTSLDGVDGVLAHIDAQGQVKVQAHAFEAFDAPFQAELMALNQSGPDELHRSALAGNQIARRYAEVVKALLLQSGLQAADITAIGAHGQTVRHRPLEFDADPARQQAAVGYTLQLINPSLLAARAKNRLGSEIPRLTVDSPVPYLLSDLTNIIQQEMGKMDRAGDSTPYMRLKNKIDEIRADPRYNFMFSGMLVSDTMADFIAKIFRMPGEGRPISIIDVSSVPSNITSTVVSVLSRLVFDYAIWSRNEPQRPILLVCEEAHRYIPSDRVTGDSAVRKVLERIAKEGRKYGVSLGLITQRPSDLAEGVLSQCGTIIAMRLNNDRDQAMVRAAMPEGARGFLDSIPALRNRECVICGEGVAIPMRVALDTLAAEKRPASGDPSFASLWRDQGGEAEILNRVVHRWRHQGR